jgi:hypothetical protein
MKHIVLGVLKDAAAVPYRYLAPLLIRLTEIAVMGAGLLLVLTLYLHGLREPGKFALVATLLLGAAALRRGLVYLLRLTLGRAERLYF